MGGVIINGGGQESYFSPLKINLHGIYYTIKVYISIYQVCLPGTSLIPFNSHWVIHLCTMEGNHDLKTNLLDEMMKQNKISAEIRIDK